MRPVLGGSTGWWTHPIYQHVCVLDGFRGRTLPNEEPSTSSSPTASGPSRRGVVISSSDAVWEARPPPRERGDELLGERSPGHKVRLARERVGRVGSSPEGWVLSSPWGWVLQRDRHRPSASLDGRARPAPSIDRFAGESLRRRRPSLWAPSPKVMLPIESRLASFKDATSWIAIDSNDGVWNAFANRYRPALYIADATVVRILAREAGPTTRICRTRCRRTNRRPRPPERTSCCAHTERMSGSGMAPGSRAAAGAMTPRRASHVPVARASPTCSYPCELPSDQERLRYPRTVLPRIMAWRSICEGPRRSPALPEAPAASARS